ncbi:serine/threonine-protein kinase SMG1 isoform X2 [Rhizophagus clarus]|uniref:non-specific serine/threonine protein kinase n=1 Tax=Rhizophagus clarus TaxID=94130 RepID=A0A8H3MBC3_9GLOM|nr:serine/threonine-protein kinase SMG1 isoform X2 [Rhizophagus clarus]
MSGSRNRYGRRSSYQHRQHQAQAHFQHSHSQENRESAKLSRIHLLLSRISDENERRLSHVHQITSLLADPCSSWEKMQIFDAVTRIQGNSSVFETVFEDNRATVNFKTAVAKCLALIAFNLNSEISSYFHWLFERLQIISTNSIEREKERKIWLLFSLKEVLSRNASGTSQNISTPGPFQQFIPGLLQDLESLLDSMDRSDCFPGILEVLEKISEKYPQEFGERFQDVIDLLVGWYIDTTVSDNLQSLIAETFKKLRPFWSQYLNFAYELMSHFLTDMEVFSGVTVSQEGSQIDKKTKAEEETIQSNIKALLSCFHAVADAVATILSQVSTDELNETTINESTHPYDRLRAWIIKFILVVGEIYMDAEWFEKGKQIIQTLSMSRKPFFVQHQIQSAKFWLLQIQNGFHMDLSIQSVDEWFDGFLQVIAQWIPSIHPEVVYTLINPDSALMKLRRNSYSSRISSDLLDMLHIVLQNQASFIPRSETDEMTLIHNITIEIGKMMSLIFHSNNSSRIPSQLHWGDILSRKEFKHDQSVVQFFESLRSLLNSNDSSLKECSINIRTATSILIFNIEILTDLAYSWHHNREIFWVFYVVLNKIGESGHFDVLVTSVLLKALRGTCRSKNYFMTKIEIGSPLPSAFCAMITILTALLRFSNEISLSIIALALDWFKEFLEFCGSYQFNSKEIKESIRREIENIIISLIITARVAKSNDIRLQIPKIIRGYFDVFGSLKLHKNAIIKIAHRLFDSDINVRNEFSRLIDCLNPLYGTFRIDPLVDQFIVNFKTNVSATPHLGNFRPPHFQIVMSHLGMKDLLSSQDEPDIINDDVYDKGQWRLRLFHSCQSVEGFDKGNPIEEDDDIKFAYSESDIAGAIANSNDLLTFWSLWEVARYCVLSRLRTPFGGPKQTFDAFEKRLNDFLIQDDSLPIVYKLDDTSIHNRLNQLRDLLILIDRLELQIYNAAVGTALGQLPQAPRASIIFFKTNRKVCDEWFSRIRTSIVKGSKIVGHDTLAIRHCLLSLSERANLLKQGVIKSKMTWMIEFQQMLMDVVQCLQRIHAVDSIIGLLIWSKSICISNEKPEPNSLSQSDDMQVGNKTNIAVSPQSLTQRTLLQRKPTNKTIPNSAQFYWMNNSHLFAEAKYESAAKESKEALNSLIKLDPEMLVISPQVQFLTSQIIDSYCKTNDLSSLAEWLNSFDLNGIISDPLVQLNQHYLESLTKHHVEDHFSAWELIDSKPPQISEHHINLRAANFIYSLCSFRGMLARILKEAASESNHQLAYAISKAASQYSFEGSFINTIPLLAKASIANSDFESIQGFLNEFVDDIKEYQHISFTNTFVNDLEIWSALNSSIDQLPIRNETSQSEQFLQKKVDIFKLMMAKIARKSSAFQIANSLLDHWKQDSPPEVIMEHAKTLYAQGQFQEAIIRACSIFGDNKSILTVFYDSQGFGQRIYLKIAKWLQNLENAISNETLSEIRCLLNATTTEKTNETEPINYVESRSIVEFCLSRAVEGDNSYDKAWFSYATYHYQRGRQIFEELSSNKTTINIITISRNKIQEFITNDWKDSNRDNLIEFDILFKGLFQLFLRKFESRSKFENDESEFREIIPWITEKSTEEITKIFHNLQEEIFTSYKCAVEGYFKYLQLANGKKNEKMNKNENVCNKLIEESDITTAALRLFRLLVKYGTCLESQFTQGFDNIDYRAWEKIIPQLFSRLDHPEPFVQQQLCKLLCAIAINSPQLVVYHTVVASNSSGTSEQNHQLLKKIADSLDYSNGALIAEIRKVIKELQHITVLWEEQWLNKIGGLQLDVNKRLHKIENEFERINDNLNLTSEQRSKITKESYDAIMKPVISSIERLYNFTIVTASTPHEQWFNQTFGNRIRNALEKLRTPTSWNAYKEGWDLFRNVHKDLTKELHVSRALKLSDISPFLSRIKSSQITMPGLTTHNETVFIQSFNDNVVILPTKTKPKKLVLLGSDGKQYGYLFKGLEDLHLDERIMQLLRITNDLFNRDKQSRSRKLRARHYAVIPLGDHSGMIQWVENTTCIFVLYKKWQHREHFAKLLQTNNNTEIAGNPLRPSDMFFEKIGKALKKEGWATSSSRRNWPKSVLKSVFLELISETPPDLLEKEVWSSCSSSSEWWDKNISLSRSLAVMSIIGYIIGLGDRHLDNILIDFNQGEVVHIDYNVCFEKGKKLRVPETIPFRLTQNLETALGITGVEGVFRIACEHALRVMRENKEMLITLLEAFVYDPLVDWNQNLLEDKDKQIMELEENIVLLASRIAELRVPLENNQKQLSNIVSDFLKSYENLQNNHNESDQSVETSTNDSQRAQSIQDGSSLSNIEVIRQETAKNNNNNQLEFESLKSTLSKRASECALWHAQHEKAIQSVQGPLLQIMYNEAFASSSQIGSPLFGNFTQIISTNDHLLQRCSNINQEFFGWMNERNNAFKNCLERLQFYRALILPIIQVLLSQDYYGKWPQLLGELLDSGFEKKDFQKIFENVNLENSHHQFGNSGNDFKQIRETLQVSCSSVLQESLTITDALVISSENGQKFGRTLSLASTVNSLIELKKKLVNPNRTVDDVFGFMGFDDNFQQAVRNVLSNQVLDKTGFLTFIGTIFFVYHHIHFATVTSPNDEILTHVLSTTTELLQLTRFLYSLLNNFENIILPKVFQMLCNFPNSLEQYNGTLCDLSNDTFNYWEMKNSEAHSVVYSMNQSFKQICDIIYNEGSSNQAMNGGINLIINGFDELFSELQNSIMKIQNLFKESPSFQNVGEYLISESVLDDFTVHKLNVISNVLLACEDFCKENYQPNQNNAWMSSIAMTESFKNSSDSLQRLYQVVYWCISDFFIPSINHLLDTSINQLGDLLGAEIDGNEADNSGTISVENLINNGYFTNEEFQSHMQKVIHYCYLGSKINIVAMINMRKTEIEMESQQRQMELMRFEWINETLIGDESLIRKQFLENLKQDVNRFVRLDTSLQELTTQYRAIEVDVAELITNQFAGSDVVVLQSFNESITNQQILFAQEFERMKHIVSLCNSILHLESFRTITEKTTAMDVDTLQLVKRLEGIVYGEQSVNNPELDIIQQLSALELDQSMDKGISRKLEIIAKEFHNTFEEIRSLMLDLILLIEPITNVEVDIDDNGKDIRSKAKDFMREWSKLDIEADAIINNVLTVFDGSQKSRNNAVADSENETILENLNRENIRAISDISDSLSRIFELLFTLCEVSTGSDQKKSHQQLITETNLETGNEILAPTEIKHDLDNTSNDVEYTESHGVYNNLISSQKDDQEQPLKDKNTTVRRSSLVMADEGIQVTGNAGIVQARNSFAVSVIRRIKSKLEGKDFDLNTKMSVSEQVDKIIQQATDTDNLCVMYEGWTAWI